MRPSVGDVVILRPGALGDTLLAVPAIRALRARFPAPSARLVLGAHPGAARLLAQTGEVDVGLGFDDPRLLWSVATSEQPHREHLAAVIAWMADPSGAHEAHLGSVAPRADVLVAPSRPLPGTSQHCSEYLLSTLAPLLRCTPAVDARPIRLAASPSNVVLVHPGSGSARKNWPTDRFVSVVQCIARHGLGVEIISGEADEEPVGRLIAALGSALPILHVDLGTLARRLAGAIAYLGNDSGVSHLAGLAGARSVVLFGPTSAATWRPLGPRVTVLPFEAANAHVVDALLDSKRG
ncbi:MAG: glycosyltransferase family 9 protein [Chloroflexi bacterium]|nr:glycosyltransferase family 9 protein [Chloroflexota bacterium]